ncbi:hypothetical protein [Streptomyces sp. NBC_00091]|uniref:hypothetical protein n=1 Tax=Streptomyces sp. NBC_00091 TaxID=2975648 RepID=UPI002252C7A3|nr:hypothetical protein [Streptomyces sp. NBC_00091]MCX5375902.1 hypothetical protein [Streptomyces sp. NBC_00091]
MRAIRTAWAVAGVLLGAVLAGCGGDGPSGTPEATAATAAAPGTPPGASPVASLAPSPAPTASASAADPSARGLVRVTRSGGFAGQTRTLLVNGDGSWTLVDGKARDLRSGRLDPAGLEALRTALRGADFKGLPRVAKADPPVYDGFTYAFVHGGFEVASDETVLAPGLRKVLEALPGFDATG